MEVMTTSKGETEWRGEILDHFCAKACFSFYISEEGKMGHISFFPIEMPRAINSLERRKKNWINRKVRRKPCKLLNTVNHFRHAWPNISAIPLFNTSAQSRPTNMGRKSKLKWKEPCYMPIHRKTELLIRLILK